MKVPDMRDAKEGFWLDYTHKRPFIKESLEMIAYDAGFRKYKIYKERWFLGCDWAYRKGLISLSVFKKLRKIVETIPHWDLTLEAEK